MSHCIMKKYSSTVTSTPGKHAAIDTISHVRIARDVQDTAIDIRIFFILDNRAGKLCFLSTLVTFNWTWNWWVGLKI